MGWDGAGPRPSHGRERWRIATWDGRGQNTETAPTFTLLCVCGHWPLRVNCNVLDRQVPRLHRQAQPKIQTKRSEQTDGSTTVRCDSYGTFAGPCRGRAPLSHRDVTPGLPRLTPSTLAQCVRTDAVCVGLRQTGLAL
jgi:hypothetical protein